MKKGVLLLFMAFTQIAWGQKLPDGVTLKSNPCLLAEGLSSHYYNKNNNMIAMIEPTGCNYSDSDEPQPKPSFQVDFYPNAGKKSFPSEEEAMKWLLEEMDNFYKPFVVTNWLKLDNTIPQISLNYPEGWSFRVDQDTYFAKPVGAENNKVVIMLKHPTGMSKIMQIIRCSNTSKQTTRQFMETSSRINPAINFNVNPPTDQLIGGKLFKTMENTFATVMLQRHFWYADDKELIYIGYGLLKDERIRYPEVVADIIKSINW